jgi:long-chain acyl-CoA synthetase
MALFFRLFSSCAERWPERTAVEMQRPDGLESYTYAEMRRMGECVGGWLQGQGVARGERCVIFADNSARWVACYLGILARGCVAVPLDNNYHADQVQTLLQDSGAVLLFADARHWPLVQQAAAGSSARLVLMDALTKATGAAPVASLDAMFAAGPGNFTPAEVQESDLAALLYTSGTTADPKGVMLTHGNLTSEVEAISAFVRIDEQDAILGLLPLFHALAQVANLLLPLARGARVVYLETLNTTELLRGLRERGITAFCVVPQFFYLIHERIFKEIKKRGSLAQSAFRFLMAVNAGLRRVGFNAGRTFFGKVHALFGTKMRLLVTGGSRFDPAIARDFHALGIEVMQAYGLTETTGGAVVTPPGHVIIGSTGRAMPGVELKIVEPQTQEEGGPAIGEIAIRGPVVMKGYYKRSDATAEALKEGWLYSGDLGYLDSHGNLFITGRRKEIIVLANGKNLYPDEIEAHYLKSPFIKELCVMALETTPGDPQSERLHAVIVPNFDTLKERKVVNAKEVIRWDLESLSADLASVKRILSYDIWQEELPRTTTRKIKRFEVARRVKEQKAGGTGADAPQTREITAEEATWLEQPDVQRALKIVKESARTSNETIRPADNLELDLGLDSMQRIELLVAIEEELGGKVEESRLGDIYTVRELVDAVLTSAAAGLGTGRSKFAGWGAVLSEDPTDPEVLALSTPQPVAVTLWFTLGRLVMMLAQDLFKLRIEGIEKLPDKGPFILSSNHQSYLDPAILGAALPYRHFRDLFSVGTSEIFGSGIMRWVARQLRIVVVDPDANLVPAMKTGAYGLRQNKVLILYPEGERSIDGPPKRFKKGVAILATNLHVPVVPIAIAGFHEAWPRGKRPRLGSRFRMKIGDPIFPPAGEPAEAIYEQFTAELKARIVEMYEELMRQKD